MVISGGIPAVPKNRNSRNSVLNPSAEEKTSRISVPWNKNRSKLSEIRSELFRRRENNSEFRSLEQKLEANSRKYIPNHSAEEKTTQNSNPWNENRSKPTECCSKPFRGTDNNSKIGSEKTTFEAFEVWTNHFVKLLWK
jgi:hypothetical protein